MAQQWEKLGLGHFPTEDEAVSLARESHPYFVWLFDKEGLLWQFKNLYDFHADVWKDEVH